MRFADLALKSKPNSSTELKLKDVAEAVFGCLDSHASVWLCLLQGAGTDEACLIEILASRTNAEIKALNIAYKKGIH